MLRRWKLISLNFGVRVHPFLLMGENNVKWYHHFPSRELGTTLPTFNRFRLLRKETHNERPAVVMDGTVWVCGGDLRPAVTLLVVRTAWSPRITVTVAFLSSGILLGLDQTTFGGLMETRRPF